MRMLKHTIVNRTSPLSRGNGVGFAEQRAGGLRLYLW